MLFLFSDVSEKDAPTVIKTGSHFDVARLLAPAADKGLSFLNLPNNFPLCRNGLLALTGNAGTVLPLSSLLYMPHKTIMERTPFYGAAGPARETKFQYRSRKKNIAR